MMRRRSGRPSTRGSQEPPARRRRTSDHGHFVAVGRSAVGTPAPSAAPTCRIATFNVRSARGGNLEALARAAEEMHLDLCLVSETKITDQCYSKARHGYSVMASEADSAHQGGVAWMWRDDREYFSLESPRRHGPNVLSAVLVMGPRRWLLLGAYIPPSERDGSTLRRIQEADLRLPQLPWIVLGDLNVDLDTEFPSPAVGAVAATLADVGVADLLSHFRQRRVFRHRYTWRQWREGRLVCSRCDYILASDIRDWKSCRITQPRGVASDHLMLVAELRTPRGHSHLRYTRRRKRCPFVDSKAMSPVDWKFRKLVKACAPLARSEAPWSDWISDTTWALFDERAQKHRQDSFRIGERRALSRLIRRSIRRDRRSRCERTGEQIEGDLAAGDLQGAWTRLSRWYRHTKKTYSADRTTKPTHEDLDAVTEEYRTLYGLYSPPGENLPVLAERAEISDAVPTPEEVATVVRSLKTGKSPGWSGMRAEHIKLWLAHAEREPNPNTRLWSAFCSLIAEVFTTGQLPAAVCRGVLVLVPKPEAGRFRGVGLLEVVWKVITKVINRRIVSAVQFHPAVHGFRGRRGTATAILDCKLLMGLAMQERRPLFQIFVDFTVILVAVAIGVSGGSIATRLK